jgi:HSP20 family protein
VAQCSFIQPSEWGDLADDVRQLFDELAQGRPGGPTVAGTCRPLVDVFETDEVIELVVDAAGVPAALLRVLFRQGVVVVAGEKTAQAPPDSVTYHLVERDFGRFARVVRVEGAFDVDRASATLRAGELTVVLPKRIERRGQAHRLPVRLPAEHPG